MNALIDTKKLDIVVEDFNQTIDSIMKCEDFKSNFARRLSTRYSERDKQSTDLKIPSQPLPADDTPPVKAQIQEEITSVIDETVISVSNCEILEDKSPEKAFMKQDLRKTEVAALNLEVETLRWQLSQTEANRQMHIALLEQVVSFLTRVKEHFTAQKETTKNDLKYWRMKPSNDLPRSRSVFHVNKNGEHSVGSPKKMNSRKISKSINNVNGCKQMGSNPDVAAHPFMGYSTWKNAEAAMNHSKRTGQKLAEEIASLITLATTVLSMKIPSFACSSQKESDKINHLIEITPEISLDIDKESSHNVSSVLNETFESSFILNTSSVSSGLDNVSNKYIETGHSPGFCSSSLTCGLEQDFAGIKSSPSNQHVQINASSPLVPKPRLRPDLNEDESGFSSMNSFQEIGIPIISTVASSQNDFPSVQSCDESSWSEKHLDKHPLKVFWV